GRSLCCNRPDREIPHRHSLNLSIHLCQRIAHLEQLPSAQLQRMLVGLVDGADRIIKVWRPRVLDMSAQNVGHDLSSRKIDQTIDTANECVRLEHINSAWIQSVACKQDPCLPVIHSYTRFLMPWNWNHIQNTAAQIILHNLVRPIGNSKELLNRLGVWFYKNGCLESFELLVSRFVIAMSMSV